MALQLSAQNIGIGNSFPLMRLHVSKSDSAVAVFENTQPLSNNVSTALYFKTGSGGYPYTGAVKTIGEGTDAARLGLFTYTSSSANQLLERLSITDNGNVGVGITKPKTILHVPAERTVLFGTDTMGQGKKLIWYGNKGALRSGFSQSDEFDNTSDNIGVYSTALGAANTASGLGSVALGGICYAAGQYSIAMGFNAQAAGTASIAIGNAAYTVDHVGSFCFSGTGYPTMNTLDKQMMMRFDNYTLYVANTNNYAYITAASNGWAYTSDKNRKERFLELNGESVLKKISAIPFYSWNFKAGETRQYRHYGIMAQDFYGAFGKDDYGAIGNDTTVSPMDLLGVAYSGIKALEKRTEILQKENSKMAEEITAFKLMKAKLEKLQAALEAIKQKMK